MPIHSRRAHSLIALGVLLATVPCAATMARADDASVAFIEKEADGESSLIGLKVKNPAGEVVGDIRHVVVDAGGRVTTLVIGVGGMSGILGMAEKLVGVPFGAVAIATTPTNDRFGTMNATKDALTSAPAYIWTEKTTVERMKEAADKLKGQATELTEKAKEKAKELTEQATKKAEELRDQMKKPDPAK